MAKKNNAIYAPGELSRIREKLGEIDHIEAKRMAQVLGGEVGTERGEEKEAAKGRTRRETVDVVTGGKGGRSGRRLDFSDDEFEKDIKAKARLDVYPGDDPSAPLKLGYRERVKMDQLSGQLAFEIKSSMQIIVSIFSLFREPIDYVNSRFVTKRMNEYYNKIERLVTSSRNLFPQNNTKRSNQLKRASPFAYKILETLRGWNIEQIAQNIARLQARPRAVKTTDFVEVLRDIYKPLFVLSDLNTEHMKIVFKLMYKILYIESPMDAKEKYQDVIRNIISSLIEIRRDVQYGMYPLLMKLLSDRFLSYERFFIERRRRFMAFLNVTATDQLNSDDLNPQQMDSVDVEALQQDADEEQSSEEENSEEIPPEEEDPNDPKVIERRAKEDAEKAEQKALEQGLATMEALFPKAGWDKMDEFPDFYPYFARLYSMKGGYELIAPRDSLQQVAVLMHILDDLFIGMRYVNFGTITGVDGSILKVGDEMLSTVNNWRRAIEDTFSKDYLPRLSEYCRMLENSGDARTSAYAKKIMNELHWIKRLFFLPYYKFESLGPPPFPKQDITPIYGQIRNLRKYLTTVAVGIEQGVRAGGGAAKIPCDGINNPWENYNFQIPNPVSRRLDMMLPPDKRINATLIFFSLAAVAVLDYIVNNENSWAYGIRPGPPFRSIRDEGIIPIFGVDDRVDTDKIFRESLKKN